MRRIQVSWPEFTGTNRLFCSFAWDRKVFNKECPLAAADLPHPRQALNIWQGKQSVIDLNHSERKPKHLLQHGGFSSHTFEVRLHCSCSRIVSFTSIFPAFPMLALGLPPGLSFLAFLWPVRLRSAKHQVACLVAWPSHDGRIQSSLSNFGAWNHSGRSDSVQIQYRKHTIDCPEKARQWPSNATK